MPTRRISVRRSPVHGRGVFALVDIPAGSPIGVYAGEVVAWTDAQVEAGAGDDSHTFLFDLGDDVHVIDGGRGGNATRWINHGCEPNCAAEIDGFTVRISADRDIAAGEELFLDYQLSVDGEVTPQLREQYACRCGSPRCRGTMLALHEDRLAS